MKRLSIGAAVLFSTLLLLGCDGKSLKFHGGEAESWHSLESQWVLINYWAEWCKPCLQEIPELNQFSQHHSSTVLGVNFDGVSAPELTRLQQQFAIEFRLLSEDPSAVLGVDRPSVLPATLLFDPQGRYRTTLIGPQTEESLLRAIKKVEDPL